MNDLSIGQSVISSAGHDKGKLFVVLCIIDDRYVYISDGNIKKVENPKKKKRKHLKKLDCISNEIKNKLEASEKITDSEIKKFIKSVEAYREREV